MLKTSHAARRDLSLLIEQPVARPDTTAQVLIRPLPTQARFSLRLNEADLEGAETAAGFTLDIPINTRLGLAERSSIRLGPNEWLLTGPYRDAEVIAGQIDAALGGRFYTLVDVSHRNVGFIVSGRRAADVLNSGCPLDLAEAAFPAGMATRTLMGKAEIVLMRLDDTPTYQVECWRSFSTYVHDYLIEAAREFEPSIA
ncbi:sarcosine oxidase subunit gamma [Microvirga sp. KLBC 81]|uniref:sarcosine oxidase subunit gamma n=1 Tax=Microvirga sp. KLBC 81 TaxID=1862707 RepID=UPI000D5137E8|nr:sarcosine oxidase subunit gamma family protein [Microvirga sp. KLBC 81]PVE21956.1 sarcosine oxidase subunit gamma [Microvirga sp. KLBC 81]